MSDTSKSTTRDLASASGPVDASGLSDLEQHVSDEAAADVRGGVTKIDALSSPLRTKWEVSEFDA